MKKNELYEHIIEEECELKLKHGLMLHNDKLEDEFEKAQNQSKGLEIPEDVEQRLLGVLKTEKSKMKKANRHNRIKRIASVAVFVIAILGVSSLILVNDADAFKLKFNSFIEKFRTEYVKLSPSDSDQSEGGEEGTIEFEDIHEAWYPEYLPEGFMLAGYEEQLGKKTLVFLLGENNEIIFTQKLLSEGTTILLDTKADKIGELIIDGKYDAYWINKGERILLTWIQGDHLMELFSTIELDELKEVAISLSYIK